MYYDRETRVKVNQSINEFYTRSLFKIDTTPQDVALPLDISATFFKMFSPDIREFLISKGVQVPPRPPTEKNHQGNQRNVLVRNAAVEAEKKTRTIKATVQPASGSNHSRTFTGTLGVNPSTQMAGLGSIFQY